MQLKIEYLEHYDKNWGELGYKHADDAGFDLRAAISQPMVLKSGERALVPNGVKMELVSESTDYEIQVRPRSGLAAKNGISLVNAPGTIDFGYRGELMAIVINLGSEDFTINPGDRIAQAVVCPIVHPEIISVESVSDNSTRLAGGFGSTGKN